MSTLAFHEPSHTYRLDGVPIPSVTQLLDPLMDFSMVKSSVMARARDLGKAVHKMTELYDADDLDVDSLSDELKPFLKGWQDFRRDAEFRPARVETPLHHPTLRYAGTMDRTGIVKGRLAVLDIKKMATLGPVVGIQLAAYKELCNLEHDGVLDRYGLSLRPDGSYRLIPYTDPLDWSVFVSLLTLHNWKKKHGQS